MEPDKFDAVGHSERSTRGYPPCIKMQMVSENTCATSRTAIVKVDLANGSSEVRKYRIEGGQSKTIDVSGTRDWQLIDEEI